MWAIATYREFYGGAFLLHVRVDHQADGSAGRGGIGTIVIPHSVHLLVGVLSLSLVSVDSSHGKLETLYGARRRHYVECYSSIALPAIT